MMTSRHTAPRIQTLSAALTAAAFAFLMVFAAGQAVALPSALSQSFEPRQNQDDGPQMLSDEEIRLIRVYEVDLNVDRPPRIDIPREVLEDFLDEYREEDGVPRNRNDRQEFLRADGIDQLELMFEMRARQYYGDVTIRGRIPSLDAFGRIHSSHVVDYFQRHFGDGQVDGLFLFPSGADGDRREMTNFFILTQVVIDGNPMIDRVNPEDSLILQWALPRDEARYPAPEVEGWRPRFNNTDDPRFVQIVEWIESLRRGNQGFNYTVPYQIPSQAGEDE